MNRIRNKKQGPGQLFRALLALLFLCQLQLALAQSVPGQNAVKTTTLLTEGVTHTGQLGTLSLTDRAVETDYLDGFSRLVQRVDQQASPDGYDRVQVIEYDARGRVSKSYLPYVSTATDGRYQSNWSSAQASFYQASGDQVANSTYPYAESRFEASPLNRALEQGAPGQDWQLGNHSIATLFETNTSGEVTHWRVTDYGELENAGYYAAGHLKVKTSIDEAGYQNREYLDEQDSVICLKEQGSNGHWRETYYVYDNFDNLRYVLPPMAVAALNGEVNGECGPEQTISTNTTLTGYQGSSYLVTDGSSLRLSYSGSESFRFSFNEGCFYMRKKELPAQEAAQGNQVAENCYSAKRLRYDTLLTAFQNRSYIIEQGKELTLSAPQSGELVLNSNTLSCFYARSENSGTGNAAAIGDYAYQFDYDERQRLNGKKVPGSGWRHFVYDNWDRLILSQNENQRTQSPREWSFTKYDALNRPILNGVYADAQNRTYNVMQQQAGEALNQRNEIADQSVHNYSLNRSFPRDLPANDVHAVTWYDGYAFSAASDPAYAFQAALGNNQYHPHVKGQITGSKTKVLDATGTWMNTVSYYDDRYRSIQVIGDHHAGGTDQMSTRYSFDGKLLETDLLHENSIAPSGQQALRINKRYQYDHVGRPTRSYAQVNNGAEVLLTASAYNELGELIEKNLHSQDGGNNYLQSIDYRYNIRGWLTHLNNADLTNDGITNDDNNDLFGMQFSYTQAGNGLQGEAQYTGNISEIHWKDAYHNRKRGYGFQYDAFRRLTAAHYADYQTGGTVWGDHAGDFDLSGIQYDKNGNILSLQRKGYRTDGVFDQIDVLNYSYQGNQLQAVSDQASVQGYNDFHDIAGDSDYSYDGNGNLLSDVNKGITQIEYNYLNLPERIVFSSGNELNYLYDARGIRLKKTVKESGQPDRNTSYVGGMVYNDNGLEFITTDAGRIVPNGSSTFRYEYHYKDHLGNTRLAFSDIDNNGTVDQSEILQIEHYYPFGMSFYGLNTPQVGPQHKYKYNGKELEDEFGLNWYDYSARLYDPSLGRWHVIDPLADANRLITHSPYHYSYNNPVLYIDPDGKNPLRAAITAVRLVKWAYKIYKKTGKLNAKSLKKAGLDELVDIAGDLVTIFSGGSSVTDRLSAAADLVIGTDFNKKGVKYVKEALSARKDLKKIKKSQKKIDDVIDETKSGRGNITSSKRLNEDEALDAGKKFLGKDYKEIGQKNSGVFRSNKKNADGTYNQFRMDKNSLEGNHAPNVPHVHLERVKPGVKRPVSNNHIPLQ